MSQKVPTYKTTVYNCYSSFHVIQRGYVKLMLTILDHSSVFVYETLNTIEDSMLTRCRRHDAAYDYVIIKSTMMVSDDYKLLITVLRQEKRYGARKLLADFHKRMVGVFVGTNVPQ